MCKYCHSDGRISLMQAHETVLFTDVHTNYRIDEETNELVAVLDIGNSNGNSRCSCMTDIKINYCPMCGRRLNAERKWMKYNKDDWIPCSVRLPEKRDDCCKYTCTVDLGERSFVMDCEFDGENWWYQGIKQKDGAVTAWMQWLEPYDGGMVSH